MGYWISYVTYFFLFGRFYETRFEGVITRHGDIFRKLIKLYTYLLKMKCADRWTNGQAGFMCSIDIPIT